MNDSILTLFPPLPMHGYITSSEHNGMLISSNAQSIPQAATLLCNIPNISLTNDNARLSVSNETARSAFLSQDHINLRRFINAWYEQGFSCAFDLVLDSISLQSDCDNTLNTTVYTALQWIKKAHETIFPISKLSCNELFARHSSVRDWKCGVLRALDWHPHINKIAIAQRDDTIRVFSPNNDLVPTLKYKLQKKVSDIKWKPYGASCLAVACSTCVIIWHVDPTSIATRPSATSVKVLHVKGHAPVSSIDWDPFGMLLASVSPNDLSIIIWDVFMETYIPIKRLGFGLTKVMWSPDGSKMFTATNSNIFRVWETSTWSCEKWANLSSYVKASCWSHDGSKLLFCTSNEPIIYSLTFINSESSCSVGGSSTAIKCVDLSETFVQTESGDTKKVGGNVLSMVWSSKSQRLAVIFQDNSESSADIVALFHTKLTPVLDISPCGFIVGLDGEIPHHISFVSQYEYGAILSIVWSSNRVACIPLNFSSTQSINVEQFQTWYHKPDLFLSPQLLSTS